MKFVLVYVLASLVVSETFAYQYRQPQPFLTDQHWKTITDLYEGRWEPTSWEVVKDIGRMNVLRGLSLTAFERRLGVFENYERLQFGPTFRRSLQGSFNPEIIPKSFDARQKWPKCEKIISTVLDQGSCASSWAVAATSAMSDRLCINSPNNTVQKHVSARNLLNCCPNCGYKCDGGYPGMAWEYWHNTGIVTGGAHNSKSGCQNYEIEPCGSVFGCANMDKGRPTCQKTCDDENLSYSAEKTFGSKPYRIPPMELDIQIEIMMWGPIQATIQVYSDFAVYKDGVYYNVTKDFIRTHAVKIIGWGSELDKNGKDVQYWLVANSWGKKWGENGFMKILRKGPDDCGINSFLIAAMPLFSKSNESWTPSTILYWSLLGVLAFELSMCLLGFAIILWEHYCCKKLSKAEQASTDRARHDTSYATQMSGEKTTVVTFVTNKPKIRQRSC